MNNQPAKTREELLEETMAEFDKEFVDKEGCQADHPDDFVCDACVRWGGREGIAKLHKRPIATSSAIKSFLRSRIQLHEQAAVEAVVPELTDCVKEEGHDAYRAHCEIYGGTCEHQGWNDCCTEALTRAKEYLGDKEQRV